MQPSLTSADLRLARPAKRSRALWDPAAASVTPLMRLFGVNIDNTTIDRATSNLIAAASQNRRTRVVFVNAHVVNEMAERKGYLDCVTGADTIFADGSGLALAARMAGTPLADNVNGTDLFPLLAAMASEAGIGIFLLGGAPGVAERATANLHQLDSAAPSPARITATSHAADRMKPPSSPPSTHRRQNRARRPWRAAAGSMARRQ